MFNVRLFALALASLFVVSTINAQYADFVAGYSSGSGVNPTFTDPTRALGAPTTFIGYQNADPFNPPFRTNDLVSVGAGGSLTVQFTTPILNDPTHAFGMDFIIFGNAGFIITNGDFSGGGITDGSLFANNTGATRVLVSADNLTYYTLNPALAPTADGLFPTDASGNFLLPVNPALTGNNFAGKDLNGIRALYSGSGGGTGYDISWAQDGLGNSVFLPSVSFVRVEVLSGKSEVDAFATVPEPGTWALGLLGLGLLKWRSRRNP
jgi:MYXO-CTERM domain-containing protein